MQIVSVRLSVPASLRSADVGIPHLPLDLGLRNEGGNGVDGNDVERAGADEELRDLERLFARVGLGDEKLVDVHPDAACVLRIHRMLGIDECADAAAALRFCHDVVHQRRFPRRLRAEDLDDPAARQPTDAECHVECQRAGRDRADGDLGTIAHPHHRPLAEISLDLDERDIERFLAFHGFILLDLRFLVMA